MSEWEEVRLSRHLAAESAEVLRVWLGVGGILLFFIQ